MGLENMRRWPMFIVFGVCLLLMLSLIHSWNSEAELRTKMHTLTPQMHECTRQLSTCLEESLSILEQRDRYLGKANDYEQRNKDLQTNLTDKSNRLMKSEIQVNHTHVDVEICKTELESLKNLQVSKTAMLETLRLEKDTLTTQLTERKQKIEELEKEVEKLRAALTTKSIPVSSAPQKVTPAAQPPKLSSALNANIPINEPVIENDAKEDIGDMNAMNDDGDFDTQM